MQSEDPAKPSAIWWRRTAEIAAVVAAWLVVRPYAGISHDARLYMGQAVFGQDPAFANSDLLIAYDQQMQFTAYVRLLRVALNWIEPGALALVATAIGLALWIAAVSWLAWVLARRWWWAIAIMVPLAGTYYGPNHGFHFAEGRATPRGIAEAIVVVAIGLALRRKVWLALGVAATAAVFHPLIAATGLVAVICLAAIEDRRWRIVALAGLPIGILAVWADPLLIGGARAFDPLWYEIVIQRSTQVFLWSWDVNGWELTAASLCVVGALALYGEGSRARVFAKGILVTVAIGLAATFILADVLVSPLGTQLQLWRVVWLGQLGAVAAIGVFIVAAFEKRTQFTAIRALLAALVLALPEFFNPLEFLMIAPIAAIALLAPLPDEDSRIGRVALWVAVALVAILGTIQAVSLLSSSAIAPIPRAVLASALPSLIPIATIAFGLVLILLVLAAGSKTLVHKAVTISIVCVVLAAGISWDGRTDWTRFVEGPAQPSLPTAAGTVVAVEDYSFGLYTIAGRPVYYNLALAAGVVFSRDLAIEFDRRRDAMALIDFIGTTKWANVVLTDWMPAGRTADALAALCAQQKAPLTLLLRHEVPGVPAREWRPDPPPDGAGHPDRFFRYDCAPS